MTDEQKVIEICIQYLNRKKEEINIYKDRLQGRSNRLFLVEINQALLTVRLPGDKSEIFIKSRETESEVCKILEEYSLTSQTLISDTNGVKISKYIEGDVLGNIKMDSHIEEVASQLHKLHSLSIELEKYNPIAEIERLSSQLDSEIKNVVFLDLLDQVKREYPKFHHQSKLIHGDFNPDNVIVTNDQNIQFIDFEYATMFDPMYDIASFMSYSEEIMNVLFLKYPVEGKKEQAYKKVIYYRVLQCLKWYNVALLKDKYNIGVALAIDFIDVSEAMLKQANHLWIKYKKTL